MRVGRLGPPVTRLRRSEGTTSCHGASGIIGTQAVVKAEPNGYTILYTNGSFAVMAPATLKSVPYDIKRDLTPIAQTAVGGVLLLVNKSFPAQNLKELIAEVKSKPDRYAYATWGTGSSGHLTMEWLKKQTGMKINHVPYRTVPQVLSDLTSGALQIAWADPVSPVPLIEKGLIRGIAIVGNVRAPRTKVIATMGEQGHPFSAVGWFGIFAPAGVPQAIAARLTAEVNKIQASEEMAKFMARLNLEPPPVKTQAQFRDIVANDLIVWKKIVDDAGIKVGE